ncbi:hypothetical protein MLD38_016243 [Melastoma candidum]|uniref:Uncharacterized protein n=1 Tax=Melastoma candidum TaxID=119954 RepID=A0ACB9RMH1_9MYRT|nr:hypothetical protein MLD38_016243 [Melastoma candidum]
MASSFHFLKRGSRGTWRTSSALPSIGLSCLRLSSTIMGGGMRPDHEEFSSFVAVTDASDDDCGRFSLAQDLASLVDESVKLKDFRKRGRMELKRIIELRIKKRVKEQFVDGKFRFIMRNIVANAETLHDAYNSLCLNANVDISLAVSEVSFQSIAEDLYSGNFNVGANLYSVATRGKQKEVLILPRLKLRIVQEAIRIVLEVIYRPHFSKISHGCRIGRSHSSAVKYICKGITNCDWWFTLHTSKKVNACILSKLISVMEERITDPDLYAFLERMFDADVLNLEFGGFPKGHGLPQEGILCPILINIYLDCLDREFYRLSMKYEALCPVSDLNPDRPTSVLRGWFRKQIEKGDCGPVGDGKSHVFLHCCRFMDEVFFAVSGPKDVAVNLLSDVKNYVQNMLYLDAHTETEILPCIGQQGLRFLGFLVRRKVTENPAVRAVHKLKEKVKLFGSQKEDAWNAGTARVGKKWLAHGLKKVKESEIQHLEDKSSTLSQISKFRKPGMETDHWYKHLMKIWMQSITAKAEESEEAVLSKHVAEPALPKELTDSFHEFQRQVEKYVSSETASILAMARDCSAPIVTTEISAPTEAIEKRLSRYGITTESGYARFVSRLVLLDGVHIIDWFSGISSRLLRWYSECTNFDEVKLIVSEFVRKSCVRTLAAKYRMHELIVEKQFSEELAQIPSNGEMDRFPSDETSEYLPFENDEALKYGILYSSVCLLSLARVTSQSRPCKCFITGCHSRAPGVYTLHVMERQRFPGWKTGFSSSIHPGLNGRRIGLCNEHMRDLNLGRVSLQSVDFGAWQDSNG